MISFLLIFTIISIILIYAELPVINSVDIEPILPSNNDNLQCNVNATDVDNNNLDFFGYWYKDNLEQIFLEWNKTFDYGRLITINGAGRIKSDSQNNLIIAASNFTLSTKRDVLTLKYNSSSNLLWYRLFSTSVYEVGHGVDTDSQDNIVVAGFTSISESGASNDFIIIKYDKDGNQLFNLSIGGDNEDTGYDVAVDSNDDIAVTGYTKSFGAGNQDVWTLKYNSSGSLLWNNTLGNPITTEEGNGITIDSQDNIIVTGIFNNIDVWTLKYNSSGSLLWNRTFDNGGNLDRGWETAVDSKDNIINIAESDISTILIIKYDSSGSLLWNKTILGHHGRTRGLDINLFDDIIVVTKFSVNFTNDDIRLFKFSPDGQQIWNKTVGGDLDEEGQSVTVDSKQDIIFVGDTKSFGTGTNNIWTVKYSPKVFLSNQPQGVKLLVSNLSSEFTSPFEEWICSVNAFDGTNFSGFFNSTKVTIDLANDTNKFTIQNSSGSRVGWFGSKGNIVLRGTCSNATTCTPPNNSFIFINSNGEPIAYVDSGGNMCIESITSCKNSDEQSSCSSPNPSFTMLNGTSSEVIVLDKNNGNLCLTGRLFESQGVIP